MPNEFYTSYCLSRHSSLGHMGIPGTTMLPRLHGKVLYYPLYRRSFHQPDDHSLGFGAGLMSVGSGVVSAIGSFVQTIGHIVGVVLDTIMSIISFILEKVMKVVETVLNAVGGLVMTVVDALTLKGTGEVGANDALQLAGFLTAKYNSLKGADKGKEEGMNRDMTEEEKAAYHRNQSTAWGKIQELAGGVVGAVGGTTNFLILTGAAAASVLLLGLGK